MRVFEKAGNDPVKALSEAKLFIEEEMDACKRIGEEGLVIIRHLYTQKKDKERFSILTHCNAGWLACGGFGTALAPIYAAHNAGLPVHVWVDETRPRNQGAKLTAWELKQSGVPFTVIPDNAGGQLMREGKVDMAIVGADRVAINGDVANKTGTYLKALAAHDNGVPFYVALPGSTFDRNTGNGNQIHIEYRSTTEVTEMNGLDDKGHEVSIKIIPDEFPVLNPGFDVTPAKLVTSLITERGICNASKDSILKLFPEFK
jgi:methylthioribose-1-phosphate isomerase